MLSGWMVYRYLLSGRRFFNLTTCLGILGMSIGVASLVVVMAVVSGFETTLKRSVIDVTGHVILVKRGSDFDPSEHIFDKIREHTNQIIAASPFVLAEAVLAHNQKVAGVLIEGADPAQVGKVLRLSQRVIRGKYNLGVRDEVPNAMAGKGLVERFGLKLGDLFQVVVPVSRDDAAGGFKPRLQTLRLIGVLDLGRHEYDERYILTSLKTTQNLARIGDKVSGYRLRLRDEKQAQAVAYMIADVLKFPFWTKDWTEVNRNLFEAVKLEKIVIFLVIFIMVLAACFNISSVLFVSVLKRYQDIAILKTMGATPRFVMRLFTIKGLIIGVLGAVIGVLLGLLLSAAFMWAQNRFQLLPGDIYKLDKVGIEIRPADMFLILFASLAVCWVSSLAPAWKGAKLNAVEGLKYE
jgi:lipoprotein-releasing system permease protein